MNITVAVMAHPSRAHAANSLALQLGQYPFSDHTIIWDQKNEEWDTGYRSMHWGANKGDWHLVLQDDAIISEDLFTNIVGAIKALPTKAVVSLYTGKVRPMPERVLDAVKKAPEGSFLSHYMLMWGVGILIPSDHIEPMLEFVSDPMYRDTLYDIRIGMFYHRNHLPIYYTMPSLVDHDDSIGSLIGNQQKEPRVAHRLATGRVSWTSHVTVL